MIIQLSKKIIAALATTALITVLVIDVSQARNKGKKKNHDIKLRIEGQSAICGSACMQSIIQSISPTISSDISNATSTFTTDINNLQTQISTLTTSLNATELKIGSIKKVSS